MTDRGKQADFGNKDPSLSVCFRLKRNLARGLAVLNPAKRRERTEWLTRTGVEFLRTAGIGRGDTVVDFGCGAGAYSIPAALLVGKDGLVVSVDVRARMLRRLMRTAVCRGLGNIRAAQHLGEMSFLLNGRPCRAILLYDVLHYMDANTRQGLYRAFHGRLGSDGLLSVFPKHLKGDSPSRHFRNMTVEDVSREIEAAGFRLRERREADLWHNPDRERGTVLTFSRMNGRPPAVVEAMVGDPRR